MAARGNPILLMLDSNAFDHVIADRARILALRSAADAGRVEVVVTHIQEDELADAPLDKRDLYAQVPRRQVNTSAFIVGLSRLGMAELGSRQIYDAVRTPQKHFEDGLIADTAKHLGAILVTGDDRLFKRAQAEDVVVWDFGRLDAELGPPFRGSEASGRVHVTEQR
jgi:predicted nucleic acid-binding protein